MIASLLLVVLAAPVEPALPRETATAHAPRVAREDVEARIARAGDDVEKLHALAKEYESASKRREAKRVHERIVELAPDDEVSRTALRHQFYDGQWFETFVALAKYKREEEARMLERGLARFEERWVPVEALPYLQMGWVRAGEQGWIHPAEQERLERVAAMQEAGFVFRADDNSWVAPDDLDHWRALEWRCGEEWLDMDAANAHHATLETCWELAGEHFVVHTPCDWETGNLARFQADSVVPHLQRVFGLAPEGRVPVLVQPDLVLYNQGASEIQGLIDSEGFSSLHGAYFADLHFDTGVEPPLYQGMGICYWDRSDPRTDPWGPGWVRWAAAQSYVDAIDRSWSTVADWVITTNRGDQDGFASRFWAEKRIPRWLRYGAASYAEGFFPDASAEGDAAFALRRFSSSEVRKAGGLRPLKDVFAFALSLNDIPGSSRLYREAGLVVAYLLDGAPEDAGLASAHDAFRTALAAGDPERCATAARALEAALLEREERVRVFGGM